MTQIKSLDELKDLDKAVFCGEEAYRNSYEWKFRKDKRDVCDIKPFLMSVDISNWHYYEPKQKDEDSVVYAEYKLKGSIHITKDGHTMFREDIVNDLNRKSYLEEKLCYETSKTQPEETKQELPEPELLVVYRQITRKMNKAIITSINLITIDSSTEYTINDDNYTLKEFWDKWEEAK